MAPVEVVISQSQLNEIITSHRELHEVVIKLSDVVQDPSRSVRYQSFPRRELHNVDLTNEYAKPDESKVGSLDTKLDSSSSSSTAVPQYSLIENHVDANDGRGGHLLPNSRIGSLLPQLQQPSLKVREGAFHPNYIGHLSENIFITLIQLLCVKRSPFLLAFEDIPQILVLS